MNRTILVFLQGLALTAALACGSVGPRIDTSPAAAAEPASRTVQLVVDYGDGSQVHFLRQPWKQGMTVEKLVAMVEAHPHGVKFTRIGSGETALVTKIGDVANEGPGRERRNWLFQVNGKLAEQGMGAQTLVPGDAVLWSFDRYDYNSQQ